MRKIEFSFPVFFSYNKHFTYHIKMYMTREMWQWPIYYSIKVNDMLSINGSTTKMAAARCYLSLRTYYIALPKMC